MLLSRLISDVKGSALSGKTARGFLLVLQCACAPVFGISQLKTKHALSVVRDRLRRCTGLQEFSHGMNKSRNFSSFGAG